MLRRVTCAILSLFAGHAATAEVIDNETQARAYIDRTFALHECRMTRAGFFARMQTDGVAPTENDMAQPLIGTDKIIRQRRVLAVLLRLFLSGDVCEDAADKTLAISKFGGCA